jgi:hypothetical protein
MALVLADRVQETGTPFGIPGSGGYFALSVGAVSGYQTFAVIGNGNTTYYAAYDTFGSWEVGIGTYSTTGPQLARTTLLASAGSVLTGITNIFCTYPAGKSVYRDAAGTLIVPGALSVPVSALTSSNTSNLDVGGPLSFSDTGIISDFVATTNSYLQATIQNKSAGTGASAEWIAYNDSGTASTNYAAFGINSSGYTGTGAINAPNNGYFITGSSDLVLGTISSNAIHLVVNSGATDAMTISTSGYIGMGEPSPLARLSIVGTGYSKNYPIPTAGLLAWDTSLGQVATFTFASVNRAFGTPTNLVDGAFYGLALIQGTGGNTITSWTSVWKWPSGLAPVLSTAAGAKDYFVFRSDGTYMYLQGQSLGVA